LSLFPCSLSVLSNHSPVLWRSRTPSQIQGAGHHHHSPVLSLSRFSLAYHWFAPHTQFSTLFHPTVPPPVRVTLFVLDPVRGNRVRAGWVLFGDFYFSKAAAECARNNGVFMAWLWCNWLGFSVSIFYCDEEMKKKTGYGKKLANKEKYRIDKLNSKNI